MADEVLVTKFYTDADPFPLKTSGRYYELRANGTGTDRNDNISMVGNFRGNEVRLVVHGTRDFTGAPPPPRSPSSRSPRRT